MYAAEWQVAGRVGEHRMAERGRRGRRLGRRTQIFYLKNRDSSNWRDKVQQEITGADGGAIQVQTMNDEDIDKRIAELEAKLKQ